MPTPTCSSSQPGVSRTIGDVVPPDQVRSPVTRLSGKQTDYRVHRWEGGAPQLADRGAAAPPPGRQPLRRRPLGPPSGVTPVEPRRNAHAVPDPRCSTRRSTRPPGTRTTRRTSVRGGWTERPQRQPPGRRACASRSGAEPTPWRCEPGSMYSWSTSSAVEHHHRDGDAPATASQVSMLGTTTSRTSDALPRRCAPAPARAARRRAGTATRSRLWRPRRRPGLLGAQPASWPDAATAQGAAIDKPKRRSSSIDD